MLLHLFVTISGQINRSRTLGSLYKIRMSHVTRINDNLPCTTVPAAEG
jgi:hypothetical protein